VPVTQGVSITGIWLRPEAALAVTGQPPQPDAFDAQDVDGALRPIWSDLAALTEGPCCWSKTQELMAIARGLDPQVVVAVSRTIVSGADEPVAALAAGSGMGERQFRRRFHRATGISPKQFADVQRVRRALVPALTDGKWAGIAHDSGFADQAHLSRDIRLRFGATPRRVAGYFGGIRHELLTHGGVRFVQDRAAEAA